MRTRAMCAHAFVGTFDTAMLPSSVNQQAPCSCGFWAQHLAALLSDGSVAVFAAPEEDFWGEGDGGAAAVEADDGADVEAAMQPLQCTRPAAGVHPQQGLGRTATLWCLACSAGGWQAGEWATVQQAGPGRIKSRVLLSESGFSRPHGLPCTAFRGVHSILPRIQPAATQVQTAFRGCAC